MKGQQNPFADYGSIVSGERFIGRKQSLQAIDSRIFTPSEPGNLAVVGDYRIGKSSLVYKGVMERKTEWLSRKILPIWLNMATFDHASSFFRALVTKTYDELEELNWLNDKIKNAYTRVCQDDLTWTDGYGRIQRFFEKIRQENLRVLFVLDEFDHARNLFRGDISGFQGLRELGYYPEWRVAYVTISRRSLRDIELQTRAISTFDLIFHKHYLGMFDNNDMTEYFERLLSTGIGVTPQLEEKIFFYCGGHPYLLDMLGYQMVELFWKEGKVDVDRAARLTEHGILDHYDHMIRILEEIGILKKMLQVLFGPVIDVTQTDFDELLRYGLIKPGKEGEYVAFSDHFHNYLRLVARCVDLWSIWRETEIALRRTITTKMTEKYGNKWIDELESKHPSLREIFDRCRTSQQRELQLFEMRASQNLIDFTYPRDLFAIIFAEWNEFKSIFGKDRNYWDQRSQLLAKVRNPLAHNRDQFIYEHEKKIAEGYCKEILQVLDK